ncbi:unnamed protein product [Linum trigynum]|uniref:Uncharacterized protein n=1 Tax=Linum trigynum TaxID=586398 RepID=A0AAV2DXU7_9ROSI
MATGKKTARRQRGGRREAMATGDVRRRLPATETTRQAAEAVKQSKVVEAEKRDEDDGACRLVRFSRWTRAARVGTWNSWPLLGITNPIHLPRSVNSGFDGNDEHIGEEDWVGEEGDV